MPWQEGGAVVAADCPPSQEESRKIARQRLRLPGYFSKQWNIDRVIGELDCDLNRYRIQVGVAEKNSFDPSHHLMAPVCEEDLDCPAFRAGELIGIELLDHIIIGNNCYISFRESELFSKKG